MKNIIALLIAIFIIWLAIPTKHATPHTQCYMGYYDMLHAQGNTPVYQIDPNNYLLKQFIEDNDNK